MSYEIQYFFRHDGQHYEYSGYRFRRQRVWWNPFSWSSRWVSGGEITPHVKAIEVPEISPSAISRACRVNGEVNFIPDGAKEMI